MEGDLVAELVGQSLLKAFGRGVKRVVLDELADADDKGLVCGDVIRRSGALFGGGSFGRIRAAVLPQAHSASSITRVHSTAVSFFRFFIFHISLSLLATEKLKVPHKQAFVRHPKSSLNIKHRANHRSTKRYYFSA